MTNSELVTTWVWSLVVAGIIVLLAAVLLVAILLTARSILNHGQQALVVAGHIADDTAVIWDLETTNQVARDILTTVANIETHGATIVEALHEPQNLAGIGG